MIEGLLERHDRRSLRELVRHWTVFGGCPKYYSPPSDAELLGQDPLTVIETLILRPDARLRDKGRSLLIEEFAREHTTAFSILRAIAAGRVQLQDMSDVTGIPATALPKDLRRLQDEFQLVERELPLGDAGGRLGRYAVRDPFLTLSDRALLHGLRQKAAQVPWARAVKKAHDGVFTIGRVSPTIRAEAKALDIALWEL